MLVLEKKTDSAVLSDALSDVFVYIDFSGIFDRKPMGRVLEQQKIAEYMFRPDGIRINFGSLNDRYIAFERSASMSRENRLAFVRADVYEPLRERMMLGMNIGDCQLSKLYAYNALLFTSGARYSNTSIILSRSGSYISARTKANRFSRLIDAERSNAIYLSFKLPKLILIPSGRNIYSAIFCCSNTLPTGLRSKIPEKSI